MIYNIGLESFRMVMISKDSSPSSSAPHFQLEHQFHDNVYILTKLTYYHS